MLLYYIPDISDFLKEKYFFINHLYTFFAGQLLSGHPQKPNNELPQKNVNGLFFPTIGGPLPVIYGVILISPINGVAGVCNPTYRGPMSFHF